MSSVIEFEVEGVPVGKGRPRAFRVGAGVRMFTPAKTERYESLVRDAYHRAVAVSTAHDGPVLLSVRTYWPIPQSRPKRWKAEAEREGVYMTSRPDGDNVLKALCDALNGIAWRDDAQVCAAAVWKFYSPRPRMSVRIERVNMEERG